MKHDKQKDGKWKRDRKDVTQGVTEVQERDRRMGRKQHLRAEYNGLELCNTEERHLTHIQEAP